MPALLNRIHARVGDLWWYSAMIFVACRSGDVINAVIGLWLVPKYVGPNELGAVLPLQQLSSFFTVPLAIVAVVFSKYVNTYATRGERGKVKSFIHDVIVVSAALFLVCIVAAYFLIPHFYSRLNIAAGSLTILVLASGFVGNLSNLFGSALQGLKKFKTMTVQSLISAPIRLVTLLVAMPFRPLSGYLLGQTTPSASCGILAALSIRKDLRETQPDATWRKDLPEILNYLWPYAICTIIGSFTGTVVSTVYRQRLPEIESSAYYMLTRFADIASFVGGTLGAVLFPLASESHESGNENKSLLYKAIIGSVALTGFLTLLFFFIATPIFALTETWSPYLPYAKLLPVLTFSTGLGMTINTITAYEFACKRIKATIWLIILNTFWATLLVIVTGCTYFDGLLPNALISNMQNLKFDHLWNLAWYTLAFNIFQVGFLIYVTRPRKGSLHYKR